MANHLNSIPTTSALVALLISLTSSFLVSTAQADPQPGEVLTELFFTDSADPINSDPCPAEHSEYEWDENSTNAGSTTGRYIYLCKRYDPIGHPVHAPITDIEIRHYDSRPNDPCPGTHVAAANIDLSGAMDLNKDNGGKFIYLCYDKTGTTELTDIDLVWFAACPIDYVPVPGNLNEGTIHAAAGMTACVSYLDSGDYSFDCGGEGEGVCGVFSTFFAENGNGGCDRGLEDVNGVCVNDDRHHPNADILNGSWTQWALLSQTNDIALNVPFNQFSQIGAHNAYNNVNDDYFIPATNQIFSMSDLLDLGVRVIDLDIHSGADIFTGTLPELCHNKDGYFQALCSRTDRLFDSAIKEIRDWMLRPENLDQTVLILLEDYTGSKAAPAIPTDLVEHDKRGETAVQVSIKKHLVDTGIGVVRRGVDINFSRADMLANKTRVAFFSQQKFYGDLVIRKRDGDTNAFYWAKTAGQRVDTINFATCQSDANDFALPNIDGVDQLISEVNGDRLAGTHSDVPVITAAKLEGLMDCAINIINLDGILSSRFPGRLNSAIWSWTDGDGGDNGDAVKIVGSTGRWASADENEVHPFVCQLNDELIITAAADVWAAGPSLCQIEAPGSRFFIPTNGWLNNQVAVRNTSNVDLWINFNDMDQEGKFVVNDNNIRIFGNTVVDEHFTQTHLYEVYTTKTFVSALRFGTPDCGAHGEYVRRSLAHNPGSNRATFRCQFRLGAGTDYTRSLVSIPVFEPLATTGELRLDVTPLSVTVNNVAPRITRVVSNEQDTVVEGQTITLDVTYADQGLDDQHKITVRGGDGSVTTQWLQRRQREVTLNHTFLDDEPTGTNLDRIIVEVTIEDESATDTDSFDLRIRNLPPTIDSFALLLENGSPAPESNGNWVVEAGTAVTLNATFSDPGVRDTHISDIDWGDGTPVDTGAQAGTASATHTFSSEGDYTVTLTVTDDDGRLVQQRRIVNVTLPSDSSSSSGGGTTSSSGGSSSSGGGSSTAGGGSVIGATFIGVLLLALWITWRRRWPA